MNTRDCPCAQWCVTYGIMPGEYHHRNCKHWHRDMEAVQTKTEIIVLGTPESDDETHNCDAMGCSSVSHALFRFPLSECAEPETSTTVEAHPNPTQVWAAISKTQLLLFANEKDARAMQPTTTSAFDIQRHPVYGTPPQVEPAPNPWKDAVLDQLARHAIDAPTDMPPADILKRVIDMAVTMATDPAISEPAPSTGERVYGGYQSYAIAHAEHPTKERAPSTAGELAKVVEDLLMYAGDNGYSHIDYADTMRHAAALLSAPALPVPSDSDDLIKALADVRDLFPIPERGSKLEHAWMEAVAFPESVPAYVRACIAPAAMPVGELTDEQILDKKRIEQCVAVFVNVATFGSNSKYEDGAPTPNRLLQLDCAKYLHGLVSTEDFESANKFLLGQFEAVPASPSTTGEAEFEQALRERDRYHDVADDLAAQIAAITDADIGEHSSANDPWHNAMLAADEFIANQLRILLSAPPQVEPASGPEQALQRLSELGRELQPEDFVAARTFNSGDFEGTETAPSTAGERDNKTEMLAKLTAWLDSLGGKLHTYSSRGIALAGFERGWEAALLQSTADHIAEQRKLVAAMPVVQLTHPTADMQIAGGAVELDYTGVQTAPNTVGWLTAARVWLAMERASTQPKRLTFEALNAVREAHQNKRTDDYFEARPQIDNTDRRRVFENGYKRGFDDGMVFQREQEAA